MLTCKYCVMQYGFTLADKERIFETEEELANHLEDWHGFVVVRDGETEESARARCAAKGIVEDTSICQCRNCREMRGEIED
jgi:hypothetical protein